MPLRLVLLLAAAACTHAARATTSTTPVPTPSVQVGSCAEPGKDGVMGERPRAERADRDLGGTGTPAIVVVDRGKCTALGNCYWNVFEPARAGSCARYLGTFAAAALEPLASKGDDNMSDVRAYWVEDGGRTLLQTYRFVRGGYQIVDVVQCKRAGDDRIECADGDR